MEEVQDVHITTKLIYFYGDQYLFYALLTAHAARLAYGQNIDGSNLENLLLLLMRKYDKKTFNINYEEPKGEQVKTELLYFSEEQKAYLNAYINKVLPKGINGKQKKLATTRIIIRLLVDFIIWKTGNDSDVIEIYKRVMKKNKKLTH